MHRGADRRRRLLLLGRTEPDTSRPESQTAVADDADAVADVAEAIVDDADVAFDESEFVNSHILAPDPGERFLSACRSNGHVPRLRVSPGGGVSPFDFEFRRPFALIGRSERCDLRFEHADVSYRHAYLQIVGGRLHCFDLASRTGTRGPDGARVAGGVEDGATISVGPVTIENLDGGLHASQDTSILLAGGGTAADGSLPAVYLEWMSGSGDGRRRTARLKRAINLLGWSKSCHVRFAREQVSRVHASLVLTGAGVWIIDLLGRGGTLLDGKRVAFARLRDGADLQIGTFAFRLRLGEPPAPAAAARKRSRRERERERDRSPGVVIHQNIVVGAPASGAAPQVHASTRASHEAIAPPPPPGVPSLPQSPPPQSGLSEGFVLSLFGQFTEMQRAMFSQTQQQMTFMTQMLASLHQNQQELIREDLRRVHEINRELQLIQMQLFQQSGAGRAAGPAGSTGPPYRLTSDAQDRSARPEEPAPGTGPRGFEDIVDVAFDFESAAASATSRAQGQHAAADEDDQSDVVPLPPDDPEHAAGPDSAADPASAQRPRGAVEQHAWLLDRMSRLERERHSRWHKIMGLLKGGRS
jgi:hypothetical protein